MDLPQQDQSFVPSSYLLLTVTQNDSSVLFTSNICMFNCFEFGCLEIFILNNQTMKSIRLRTCNIQIYYITGFRMDASPDMIFSLMPQL